MKYLRKLVSILFLPILLIILTNCNSNVGSNANTSGTNSTVATATAVNELTVTESYAYGSVDSTHNTSVKGVLSVVLMFNAPLDQTTVTSSNIYIQDTSGTKIASNSLQLSDNSQTVILTPAQALNPSTSYSVIVTTNVKSTMGLTLKSSANFPFTMTTSASDVKLPTVALLNPYGSSTNIQIAFSEAMSSKDINTTYIRLYSGTSTSGTALNIRIYGPTSTAQAPKCTTDYRICPIIITNASTGAIITPKGTYTLSITTKSSGGYYTITDLAGNHLVENTSNKDGSQSRNFTFTVADPAAATTVAMTNPSNNQTNVAPSTSVTLQFSNVVYGVDTAVTLHSGSATGPLLPISKIEDKYNDGKTYVITPTNNLPINSPIYVVMGSGVQDNKGYWLSGTNFLFYTSASTSPSVTPNPAAGNIDATTTAFNLAFSDTVSNVTSSSVLLLESGTTPIPTTVEGVGKSYVVTAKQALNPKTKYVLSLTSAITYTYDGAQKNLEPQTINYTTLNDTIAPHAYMMGTNNYGFISPRIFDNVPNSKYLQIMFDQPVINVDATTVQIYRDKCGSSYPLSVESIKVDPNTNTYTFNLYTNIFYNFNYCISISKKVTDTNGNSVIESAVAFNTYTYVKSNAVESTLGNSTYAIESTNQAAVTDSLGNVYIAGSYSPTSGTSPYYIVKYDINGKQQGQPISYSENGLQFRIRKILLDSSNNLYVIGYSYKNNDIDKSRILVRKYDAAGNIVWTYQDSDSYANYSVYNQGRGGVIFNNYLYVVASKKGELSGDIDGYIYKFSLSSSTPANPVATKQFAPSNENKLYANAITYNTYDKSNTHLFVTGRTQGTLGSSQATKPDDDYEGFVMEIKDEKDDLSIVNTTQFGTKDDNGSAGRVDPQDIIIYRKDNCYYKLTVGSTNYPIEGLNKDYNHVFAKGGSTNDIFMHYIPLSSNGCASTFSNEYGTSDTDSVLRSVVQLPTGELYMAGTTTAKAWPSYYPDGSTWQGSNTAANMIVAVIDNSVSIADQAVWNNSNWIYLTASGYIKLYTLVADSSGDIHITGLKQTSGIYPVNYFNYLINQF